MITEYCIGCIHLDEDLVACLYCLNRRVSRAYTMGEPGGDGCRCRELGPHGDKMREQIAREVRGRLRFAEALEKRAKLNAHRLKLYKAGCTDAEIAERCGTGVSSVQRWRRVNELPINSARIPEYDLRRELYKQGLTDRQIADKLGVPPARISNWRNYNGWPPNKAAKEDGNDNK